MDKTCHFYPPHHGFVTGNKPVTPVTRVRVLLGYGFTYPYPNPSSTRLFTPGFGLPVAIPNRQSLLQRLAEPKSSKNLKRSLNPSGAAESLKQLRSPQSFESSGRTLMSRFLNPKRKRLSTPISQKSLPSNPPRTNLAGIKRTGNWPSPTLLTRRKEIGDLETRLSLTKKTKMTDLPRSNDSTFIII